MNAKTRGVILFTSILSLFSLMLFEAETVVALQGRRPSNSAARARAKTGDLYRQNCARCHGPDGRGDTPLGSTYNAPDFTDQEWWRKHSNIASNASLASIVTRGKGGMPAFGKKLSRSEIKLLVSYVRRFRNQPSN
jgi:mono/diheme cytochrome c family protein